MKFKIKIILLVLATTFFLGADDTSYRYRLCLNGVWEAVFTKAEQLPETVEWMPFRIPAGWGGMGQSAMGSYDTMRNAAYGIFRLKIFMPQEWKGRKIELEFEQLANRHSVSFNGTKIHEHPEMMVWSRVSVPAETIKFGEWNELLVQTSGPGSQWRVGVSRDVFLHVLPQVSIRKAHARTSVRKKTLEVLTRLENPTGKPVQVEIITEVRDGDRTVLHLPPRQMLLDQKGELLSQAEWQDPILWGFGEYGKPHLYTLRSELRMDGKTADVKYERFGFREFRTQGDKFLLNEKPIFLKGDVGTHTRPQHQYVPAALQYYSMMRQAGFNLLRLHSFDFDPATWFEAADEFGFLVETETWRIGKGRSADDPLVLRRWTNYVEANCNHPSIILWCVDNERFQTGQTNVESLRKINLPLLQSYERLYQAIREIDPTRIIDMHDNHGIYAFVEMNLFSRECFEIFNIHPYGNLKQEINSEIRNLKFRGEVPILVGEVFTHPKDLDFVHNLEGTRAEQRRNAQAYKNLITQASSPDHVSGIITCAETGDGRIGFTDDGTLRLGPWDFFAQPKNSGVIRKFQVEPRYPSLSGTGVKAKVLNGWNHEGAGSWPTNMNWFDPHVPPFYFNTVNTGIREAFSKVDGKEYMSLPSFRHPELLVAAGKSESGNNIWLTEKIRPEVSEGVIADPDGNAWFRLNGTGTCIIRKGGLRKEAAINAFPALTGKPGYDHLTWVDFGADNIERQKEELKKPARKIILSEDRKGEILRNNDLEFHSDTGMPYFWTRTGALPRKSEEADSGKFSMRLNGSSSLRQKISLQVGRRYRISARVRRLSGEKDGSIQIWARQQSCFKLKADTPVGKWQTLSGEYTANGKESEFRLQNHSDGSALYDALSIELLDMKNVDKLEPGPFKLDENGFILHWLTLGPFPNPGNALDGYRASTCNYLAHAGEEHNQQLLFGEELQVEFDDGAYWIPGRYKCRVTQWHALKKTENIKVVLPEAGIVTSPAANVAAYLGCELVSPKEQEVEFRLGSDDGYVFYLNGKKLGAFHGNRAAEENQERFHGVLRKGKNNLLVKSIQETGGWSFICQVLSSSDGKPVNDISIILPKAKNLVRNPEFAGQFDKRKLPGWSFDTVEVKQEKWEEKTAVRLQGAKVNAVQSLKVEPGATYKVSGWVYTENPSSPGCIGLRSYDYKWLIRLASNNHVGKWEYMEGYCTIPSGATHVYFYCMNFFIREQYGIWYAEPTVTLISRGEK